MKTVMIQEMLHDLGVEPTELILGDYDSVGEFTAKKMRQPSDPMYKHGCFFRPNYERGILLNSLIKKYDCDSILEIGFGRGYGAICCAKALIEHEARGDVTSVDIKFDRQHLEFLAKVFPSEIVSKIKLEEGSSDVVLDRFVQDSRCFDLIYIDGDHTYEGTKRDWERAKQLRPKVVVFDDYHLPGKVEKDIECARLIDEIDWETEGYLEPVLVKTDRRIFHDDRRISDEDLQYGQVVMVKA